MKDKTGSSTKKKVFHQGNEGQNWVEHREKVLHRGNEGQNWVEHQEKSSSSEQWWVADSLTDIHATRLMVYIEELVEYPL
jgi:hypothetical protein